MLSRLPESPPAELGLIRFVFRAFSQRFVVLRQQLVMPFRQMPLERAFLLNESIEVFFIISHFGRFEILAVNTQVNHGIFNTFPGSGIKAIYRQYPQYRSPGKSIYFAPPALWLQVYCLEL